MALIKWKDEYSVKVPQIDEQHKKLIALINTLADAMSVGRGQDVLNGVLSELMEYTEYHFRTEEQIFRKYHYPEQNQHVQVHGELTVKSLELKAAFDRGETKLSIDVMLFLSTWLNRHILEEDKRYEAFVVGKGALRV